MKKILFIVSLFIIVLFTFCSKYPPKIEKLISDYEQTNGNVKTNLDFKILELKKIGSIKRIDSLKIYTNILDSIEGIVNKRLNKTRHDYKLTERAIDSIKEYYSALNDKTFSESSLDSFSVWNKRSTKFIISKMKGFIFSGSDSIYANKWACTYSIKNPMLNNAKQTISKTYLIYSDESGILSSENQY